MSETTPSGLPRHSTGLTLQNLQGLPAGVIQTPDRDSMLPWRREPHGQVDGAQLWLMGVHGGAGVSTLQRHLAGAGLLAGDAGRAWPMPDGLPVFVVTRTHLAGLRAAQTAALQYLSRHAPDGVEWRGCILVPDAPGKLPRPMVQLAAQLVTGTFPHTLAAPFVDELRLVDPHDSAATEPPPAMSDFAELIQGILPVTQEA